MFKPLALAAVLAFAAAPALAGDQDFTLHNKTGYTIDRVYVSAAKANDWEEDVMGDDVLEDDNSVAIKFASSENACMFDMKVVYDDKEEAVWSGLNLCEISEVEITYNRKTGDTFAKTK